MAVKSPSIGSSVSLISVCKNILDTLNFELTNFMVKKIKFLGKSYKIKKCTNYFAFEFNKAHLEVIVWKGYLLKKLKKSTILVKGINSTLVSGVARSIINIKHINPFTLRGLRFDRCYLKKKQGKKTN
jgi:ribosomal protein L6P/L9E